MMKRTTVFLPEHLALQLQRAAHQKHVSAATLVREAVTRYLNTPESATSLPSIAGKFSSGKNDTSERSDELLWQDPHA